MKIIIIGAGPAGVSTVETIRTYNRDAEIMMLSAEPNLPYSPPAMASQQAATLRTVVFAEDITTLRAMATARLESRLQQLVDVQRNWLAADFYDEHEASEGLDLAEDGKWVEAAESQHRAAEQPGLSPNIVARLLYNAGLCQAFVDEGANLDALESGLLWMEQAQRLVQRDARIEHGLRFLRTRQRSARLLHAQRAAAHHNFMIAGMVEKPRL